MCSEPPDDNEDDGDRCHLLRVYYVQAIVFSALHVLTHWVFTMPFEGAFFFLSPSYKWENQDSDKFSNFHKVVVRSWILGEASWSDQKTPGLRGRMPTHMLCQLRWVTPPHCSVPQFPHMWTKSLNLSGLNILWFKGLKYKNIREIRRRKWGLAPLDGRFILRNCWGSGIQPPTPKGSQSTAGTLLIQRNGWQGDESQIHWESV